MHAAKYINRASLMNKLLQKMALRLAKHAETTPNNNLNHDRSKENKNPGRPQLPGLRERGQAVQALITAHGAHLVMINRNKTSNTGALPYLSFHIQLQTQASQNLTLEGAERLHLLVLLGLGSGQHFWWPGC